jgi:pimeloyl-ACP methyl ester carboxylesterase
VRYPASVIPPAPPRPARTRFAAHGAARLAYDPGAPGGDPAAPPVVLLHPLLGDRGSLGALAAALAAPAGGGRRTIVPEARGHGASAGLANRRLTLTDLAADLLAVLAAEGVARAHLVGQGLGAATAFELARRRPERVASLTLIEPSLWGLLAGDPDPAARAEATAALDAARRAADLADKGQTDRALDAWLDPRWGRGWRESLPRPRLAALRRQAGALAGALTALAAYPLIPDDARALAVPTLLLHGTEAAPLDRLIAERLAALLPDARVAEIPIGAGVGDAFGAQAAVALVRRVGPFLTEPGG